MKNIWIFSAGMLVALCVCLSAGCVSSSTQNRKVYDRYAELVAARNREAQASASRPAAKPAESIDRHPIKAEPAAKPTPVASTASAAKPAPVPVPVPALVAKPAPVAKPVVPTPEPAPVVVPPAPVPVPAPVVQSAPVPPPPVQVLLPKPAEQVEPKPTEAPTSVVQPAPVPPPKPEPVAAPVQPVSVPPAPVVSEPIPTPVAEEPAPILAPTTTPFPAPTAPTVPAPVASPVSEAAPSIEGAYVLKVGDGVQVYLRGIPTAEAVEDVIDEDGMISLPLINEVHAAGMTASELERNIRKTYLDQDIYRNITVNVGVPTRFYFIQGEIRAPGRFQILSATRVSQAIAGAGGYTEYASGQVLVKRGGKIIKTIRDSRRLERTPEDDVLLEPDDIIEVRRSLW